MTTQLGLFALAPVVTESVTPRAPDPWAWRVDYVETHWEDGLRAWLCNPGPGLWLCVAYDAEEDPPYTWRVERGTTLVAEGEATSKRQAMDAAERAGRRLDPERKVKQKQEAPYGVEDTR